MAISIALRQTESNLFCASKWWGDPDMQEDMEYPLDDGYPMTFLCQINCEYLAPLDPEGILPHEGMLYFFASADHLFGYETPYCYGRGEWPRQALRVKYAKDINFETFRSCVLEGEDGSALSERPLEIVLGNCPDDDPGLRMLGELPEGFRENHPDWVNLLQLSFGGEGGKTLNIAISPSDLRYGNWKKAVAFLKEND